MTINADLLKRTLAHIEAHPGDWEQANWRCSSGMCFAGLAVDLDGGVWVSGPESYGRDMVVADAGDLLDHVHYDVHASPTVTAETRARRILGLTQDQADTLFSPINDLDDLRTAVAELCAEAEAAP